MKGLKDDADKKNGELYVKFLKKSLEKVSWLTGSSSSSSVLTHGG